MGTLKPFDLEAALDNELPKDTYPYNLKKPKNWCFWLAGWSDTEIHQLLNKTS